MIVNGNIKPRPLTEAELADRKRGVFDSYANYLVFCGKCGRMRKTNMYVMRAEAYIDELNAKGESCPGCGARDWTLGYPENSVSGVVKY